MGAAGRTDPRHLREVLEFVIAVAREAQRRSSAAVPTALKPFLRDKRVPTARLGALARAVEGDPTFRARIGESVTADDVGELGALWLQRPAGWEARLAELVTVAEREEATHDLETALKRADKRRLQATQARARLEAELMAARDQLAAAHADAEADRERAVAAEARAGELSDELDTARSEARRFRQRANSLQRRLDDVADEQSGDAAPDQPEGALAPEHRLALADITKAAAELADRLADLEHRIGEPAVVAPRPRSQRRVALVRPGGVRAGTAEEADFLLRAGAAVLVDGYNVAKLAWPELDLAGQRERLVAHAEDVAARFGSDITVVFDGADVPGAATTARRGVRVMYSPAGVIADDVIRAETDRVPASRAVVVVTEDRAIVRDVRAAGANVIPSRVFAAAV